MRRLLPVAFSALLLVVSCGGVKESSKHSVRVMDTTTSTSVGPFVGATTEWPGSLDLGSQRSESERLFTVRRNQVDVTAFYHAIARRIWNDTATWNAAAAARNADAVSGRRGGTRPALSAAAATSRNPTGHSDAWWHGVAVCEQGGKNDPFYGFLSYMDGSAGGKSWAEQVAMGNRTIARVGDHAWAQTCVEAGYRAAPGG